MTKVWLTAVLAVVSASAYAQEKTAVTRSSAVEGEVYEEAARLRDLLRQKEAADEPR